MLFRSLSALGGGSVYSVSLSETVTLTTSVVAGISSFKSLSETVTLTSSASAGMLIDTRMAWGIGGWGSSWWGSGPSLYDTLTLTDAVVATPPIVTGLSETTTLSTSVVSIAALNKAISEAVTLTATPVSILQATA